MYLGVLSKLHVKTLFHVLKRIAKCLNYSVMGGEEKEHLSVFKGIFDFQINEIDSGGQY